MVRLMYLDAATLSFKYKSTELTISHLHVPATWETRSLPKEMKVFLDSYCGTRVMTEAVTEWLLLCFF